jgi:hypothetical protein
VEPSGWFLVFVARLVVTGKLRRALRAVLRRLAVGLGIRRITPRQGEHGPTVTVHVEPAGDTGGAYRPKHRPQDPSVDPREPGGGESSSRGTDHGWANCTMSSGAVALAYQTGGRLALWGGDLRHAQGDLDGGTDLNDVRDAWAEYGESLSIRSGDGWGAVVDAHEAGRAIIIQGEGNVPGSGTFDGGHASCIGVETRSSDGYWLWSEPTVDDWQWVSPSKIKAWAQAWNSDISFAVSSPSSSPEPEPDKPPPIPEPLCYSQADMDAIRRSGNAAVEHASTHVVDELVGVWVDWFRAPAPRPIDAWDLGAWAEYSLAELDPCSQGSPAAWAKGIYPTPVVEAIRALTGPSTWDAGSWRETLWAAV